MAMDTYKILTLPALGALLLLGACQGKDAAGPPAAGKGAPPEVGVVTVTTQDAPLVLELPGRLSASQVAEIRPQVGGIVVKRLFTEGAQVKAGQPLYQLDAASFEAERARAAAALQKSEASLVVARSKAARDAELLKADAISRQSADDSAGALHQAEADVAVAVAPEAVQTLEGRSVVFVRRGDQFEAVPVQTGRADERQVEIVKGLAAGDRHAARNSFLVKAEIGKSEAAHEH